MTALTDLLDPARRPQTVDALIGVIEAEVKGKSGLSGTAVKAGYAAVTKIDAKLVRRAVNGMLPDFLAALQPLWDQRGAQPFGTYLAANESAAGEALLAVTDARAANPKHSGVAKVYGKLRGKAKDHVTAALPRLGATLESLAGGN